MSRPVLEVADIFRASGPAYRAREAGHLSRGQLRVMSAIESCRTAALGGHVTRCENCAHIDVAYNSCRNRHCPKCQAAAAYDWLEARRAELLPVAYYHVVFTLPAPIADIAYTNKAVIYDALFKAASETLLTIAADPKHLGAKIGVTMVLHTWGSALTHHPHVHCIVPGGGISPDGQRWISCRTGLLPAGARAVAPVSPTDDRAARSPRTPPGALQFFGRSALPRRCRCVPRLLEAAPPHRMGGLRQTPVRRPASRARLSRPLHPSRRHRQFPARRLRRRAC